MLGLSQCWAKFVAVTLDGVVQDIAKNLFYYLHIFVLLLFLKERIKVIYFLKHKILLKCLSTVINKDIKFCMWDEDIF